MTNGMEELARKSQECITKASPALKKAEDIAVVLKLTGNARELESVQRELARDRFTVLVFGRFKCGKSTFLNALLGKSPFPPSPRPYRGLMPVDVNPCTAAITKIHHSEKPEVYMIPESGSVSVEPVKWTFEMYHEFGTQKASKAETKLAFQGIAGFEVGYPTPFCLGGVELIDAPGTDDNPDMDLQTFTAARDADAAVFLLSHPGTGGQQELAYLEDLKDSGLTSFLTIVNARDPQPPYVMAMPPSKETVAVIWNRFVSPIRNRPQFREGDRLESEDVFFLNSLQAFNGRLEGDEDAVRRSGILQFERRLADYLQDEPRYIHLQRFLGRAEAVLNSVDQAIAKQSKALEIDQQGFQNKLAELLPKLEEVPKRARRIPEIIKYARTQSQISAQRSFEQLYASIVSGLPTYMKNQPLPMLHKEGFIASFKGRMEARVFQKRIAAEAQSIAHQYIQTRVKAWQKASPEEEGLGKALTIHIDNMIADLRAEATAIERGFAEVQLELTGWTPPTGAAGVKSISLAERVTAAIVGGALLSPDVGAIGAVGGWKAVGRDLVARLAVAVPLVVIFHATAIVTVPLAILAGVFWSVTGGVAKLEASVKESVVKALIDGYPENVKESTPGFDGLRSEPQRRREDIGESVKKKFDEIEAAVMQVVNSEIQAEQQSLQNQQEDALRNAADRASKLEVLKGYAEQIRQSRAELKQALTSAAQTSTRRPN